MYTVVYVVVDNKSLCYYNEMMKSLTSLRMHMPEQKVCVLVDDGTYEILKEKNAEVFQHAEVIPVSINNDYSQAEKSRFLKVTLRQRLSGTLLFIDTDTVICDVIPEIDMKKSMGMVLDLHELRSESNFFYTDLLDVKCGLDSGNYDYYYNSGVVWSKDDEHAHRIYEKWHSLWEQTRKTGIHRDQPALNYIVKEEQEHIETLDGIWNCQIATEFGKSLNYLADAHIVHYFSSSATTAYKFAMKEYTNLPYNDPNILEMLQKPKQQFDRCRVVRIDDRNEITGLNLGDRVYSIRRIRRGFRMWKAKRQMKRSI